MVCFDVRSGQRKRLGQGVLRMNTMLTNSCTLLIQLAVFNLVTGRCMDREAPRARGESLSPTPRLPVSRSTLQLFTVSVQLGGTNRRC